VAGGSRARRRPPYARRVSPAGRRYGAAIAAEDPLGYVEGVERVLESFETRSDYLEDMPVADTVLVLQALAGRRGLTTELASPLLPAAG